MSEMREQIPLPGPEHRPTLHPVEVPQARASFRRAWLFSLAGSAQVLTCVAAAVWASTGRAYAPALALVSTGVVAELARRHHAEEAWAHIPRRRRDTTAPLPPRWARAGELVRSLAMVLAVVLVLGGLAEHGYDPAIRSFATGTAAAVGMLVVIEAARSEAVMITGACVLAGVATVGAMGWVGTALDVVVAAWGGGLLALTYAGWVWAQRRTSSILQPRTPDSRP